MKIKEEQNVVGKKKKLYLSIDWESRSVSVSRKESYEEWKKYLEEENRCGVSDEQDGRSVEIYDEDNEDSGDSMVELQVDEKFLVD